MFSCEFFEISKNILSTEHLRTTIPDNNVPFALKNVGAESAVPFFFPCKIFVNLEIIFVDSRQWT